MSSCYHRIGIVVNPTCDGIRGSVGAGDRMGQRRRQLQAVGGRHLIEPFEDAGADARVKQTAGLLSKQGDIPGAYWAALTHPATTQDIVSRIFAGVHMLSHVVDSQPRWYPTTATTGGGQRVARGKCGAPATASCTKVL